MLAREGHIESRPRPVEGDPIRRRRQIAQQSLRRGRFARHGHSLIVGVGVENNVIGVDRRGGGGADQRNHMCVQPIGSRARPDDRRIEIESASGQRTGASTTLYVTEGGLLPRMKICP